MSPPISLSLGLSLSLIGGGGAAQFAADGLPVWSAGVRATQAETADTDALYIGDSVVAGVGNGGVSGSLNGNAKAFNPCAELADLFAASIAPADANSVFGNARRTSAANYNAYNNRAVFSGTWTLTAASTIVGGGAFNVAAAGSLTYDLGKACNRLELGLRASIAGVLDIKVGGSTVATATTTNGYEQTFTLPDGTTSVELAWVSGNPIIHRIQGRNTLERRVQFGTVGQPGVTLSGYTAIGSFYATRSVITALAPKLVVLDSWINEATAVQDETTYKTAFQNMIDTSVAAGSDVLLVGGHHISGGSTRATYIGYLQDLATLNGLPFFDLAASSAAWASYAAAASAGYMDADGVHLTALGASAKADALYARLT